MNEAHRKIFKHILIIQNRSKNNISGFRGLNILNIYSFTKKSIKLQIQNFLHLMVEMGSEVKSILTYINFHHDLWFIVSKIF